MGRSATWILRAAAVLLFVSQASAISWLMGPSNTQGWLDTAKIDDTLTVSTYYYTRALKLTDGEDIRVLVKANDQTNAGFTGDSIKFAWGYQTGCITVDSAGRKDTAWADLRTVIDTMDTDSLGSIYNANATSDPDGGITKLWNSGSDTLSVTGYAVQDRWFLPEWNEVIRYWALPLTGHKTGAAISIVFEQHRRAYIQTRGN